MTMRRRPAPTAIAVLTLAISGCGHSEPPEPTGSFEQNSRSVKAGRPAPSTPIYAESPRRTFHGYECTQDCSGHEAGYRWAEQHDIDDPEDCGGDSESFIEGCKAYAEEQGVDDDDEDQRDN